MEKLEELPKELIKGVEDIRKDFDKIYDVNNAIHRDLDITLKMQTIIAVVVDLVNRIEKLEDNKKNTYSEQDIRNAISKCYSFGHANNLTEFYKDKDDNLICVAELEERLFGSDIKEKD